MEFRRVLFRSGPAGCTRPSVIAALPPRAARRATSGPGRAPRSAAHLPRAARGHDCWWPSPEDRFEPMIPPSSGSLSRRRFLTVAGVAAAGALLLGACGSDAGGSVSRAGGDEAGNTTHPLSADVALARSSGGQRVTAGPPG